MKVLNQPFHATGNVATAGGCLAAQYLAAWVIARTAGPAGRAGARFTTWRRLARKTNTSSVR